jgi:hypothetical protein
MPGKGKATKGEFDISAIMKGDDKKKEDQKKEDQKKGNKGKGK